MEKGAVFLGVLLIIGGIVLIACSLITETYPHTYTQKIEGVPKTETLVEYSWSQMGAFQGFSFNLSEGDTVNIYYRTGKNQFPNSPLFFAIVDEANYAGYSSMDERLAHAEYAIAHPGEQIENWNWTVPYNSTWHFIFDFRQTFREDVYIKLTKYWIGTDYREVTEYLSKPLMPSYFSYLGIIAFAVGIGVLVYRFKVHVGET